MTISTWILGLLSAVAGSAITLALQAVLRALHDRGRELQVARQARAALQMLLSSVENASIYFPGHGYDTAAFNRTFGYFLGHEMVEVLERVDPKVYWRMGDIEQHMDLINRIVDNRQKAIEILGDEIADVHRADLKAELLRLHEECRKALYGLLEILDNLPQHPRYAAYRFSASIRNWRRG